MGRDPLPSEINKKINFGLIKIWMLSILLTTGWVIMGIFTKYWMVSICILLSNIFFNKFLYLVPFNEIKRKLLLGKSILFLSIIILLTYLLSLQ